ncbi:MAG: (2Fe-2S)-binding protein [Candidatus Marinimicrobia bacterium]|nr:(2Fe-2S)-binding protein [Candidatus Neomarinimicrobiota bacterium]
MKNWLKRLVGNDSCEVHFEGGPIVVVDSGTTIMDAGKQVDVEIDSFCGGNCSCSTCKVMISDGAKCLSKVSAEEQTVLGQKMVSEGYRLSCQTKVQGIVHVKVPKYF